MTDGKRILYFTCQPLYLPGETATGGALRAWGIGRALEERGHEVIYSEPGDANPIIANSEPVRGQPYSRVEEIPGIISRVDPDIVIMGNWGLADNAAECDPPVVVDINGSLILENYYRRSTRLYDDMLGKLRALEKVDLIITGSNAQKTYLLSWCLMAGMNPDHFKVNVLPFSLPPSMPENVQPEEPVLVMAGYNWPWLNGQQTVEVISRELDKLDMGHLDIYSSDPPYHDAFPEEDSSGDLRGEMNIAHLPRVRMHGRAGFSDLVGRISRCSVAVDVWQDNMERELAMSSRAIVYLWCGLPIITNRNAGISEMLDRYGAGWTLSPSDENQLASLVRKIIQDPGSLSDPRTNAARLFRERFSWDKTIEPLDRFCRHAKRSRSRSPFLNHLDHLESGLADAKKEKAELENLVSGLNEKVEMLSVEARLLGDLNRRPRGLELMFSPVRSWKSLRRYIVGVPFLVYLFFLGALGDLLHGLRERWGMR